MRESCPFGWSARGTREIGRESWSGFDRDFHIVSKPGVALGPVEGPFENGRVAAGSEVGVITGAAHWPAGRDVPGLPAIAGPDEIEACLLKDTHRFSGFDALNGPMAAVKFEVATGAATALGVGVAAVDGIDAIEDLAVNRRAEELEVFGMRPDERHGGAG